MKISSQRSKKHKEKARFSRELQTKGRLKEIETQGVNRAYMAYLYNTVIMVVITK